MGYPIDCSTYPKPPAGCEWGGRNWNSEACRDWIYAAADKCSGPVQISIRPVGTTSLLAIRGWTIEDAIRRYQALPAAHKAVAQSVIAQEKANRPTELFPGAVALATIFASAGLGWAGAPAIISALGTTLSSTVEQLQTRPAMALNLSGILGTVGGLLGGVSAVPWLQGVGEITQAIAPAFAPTQLAGPVYMPPPAYPQPTQQPQPVMAGVPAIGVAAGAIARMTAPILLKMAIKLGKRNISLQRAITMIRKMGKMLMDPAAIAVALGLTVGELATLITAHSSKKTRHMNPANGKALRRAARRIKSFHRMCGTIDLLKSRGRRGSRTYVAAAPFCQTCRKRPCRC